MLIKTPVCKDCSLKPTNLSEKGVCVMCNKETTSKDKKLCLKCGLFNGKCQLCEIDLV